MEKLNDTLSRKEHITLDIEGTCDNTGILVMQLSRTVKLNNNFTHKIALVSLETTAFFPNVDNSCNKFYYSIGNGNIKIINVPTGAYDISDEQDANFSYNQIIKKGIHSNGDTPDNIKISLVGPTGKVMIEIKGEYRVYFNRDNTWRNRLGFHSVNLAAGIHTSNNIANVLPTQKIYVGCNLCVGSIGKGIGRNVLFSFSNHNEYGSPIILAPNPLRPRELQMKEFDSVRLEFFSEDGEPINFQGSQVTGEIAIWQV